MSQELRGRGAPRASSTEPHPDGLSARASSIARLVQTSRHGDAIREAEALAAELRVRPASRLWTQILALLVFLLGRHALHPRARRLIGWCVGAHRLSPLSRWELVRSIGFAWFWCDIWESSALALLQLAISSSEHQARLSLAWIGYGQAYAGRPLGVRILIRALTLARRADDRPMLVEILPLLAIAHQMCGDPARAERRHLQFLRRFGGDSPFYKLLVLTNLLGVSLRRLDFPELRSRIDQCFALAFALDKSRHIIQVHGSHAILLAAEGRRKAALEALSTAERAATMCDDPLDWVIYHRLAAMTSELLLDEGALERHVERGLAACTRYGSPRYYTSELRLLGKPRGAAALRLEIKRAEGLRRYLLTRLETPEAETFDARSARLSRQLAATLTTYLELPQGRELTVQDLVQTLKRTFDTQYVVVSTDLASLQRKVLAERGIEQISVPIGDTDEVRLLCSGGEHFFGVRCIETSEFTESLAVGISVAGLDVVSESIIRGALRLVLAQYVFVKSIHVARERSAQRQRFEAIARTSQMLAHDVRRPFALVRMGMEALRRARDPIEIERVARSFLPELDAALTRVTSLISDIMDFGSEPRLRVEPVLPEQLLLDALEEALRAHPAAQLTIRYELLHDRAVLVDAARIHRALANIVVNAIQALGGSGELWCIVKPAAQDTDARFLEIILGNDGPCIDPGDLDRLFEPFFTKNKSAGTGLGLSVAHHVIHAHGGGIACRNTEGAGARGVEFVLTLPAASAPVEPTALAAARTRLPKDARAALGTLLLDAGASRDPRGEAPADDGPEPGSPGDPKRTAEALVRRGSPPEGAVLDDSRAMLSCWRSALRDHVHLHCFSSPADFWAAAARDAGLLDRLVFLVTDQRFEGEIVDGLTLARAVRQRRPDLFIAVSTSGLLQETDLEGAADLLLEKDTLSWSQISAHIRQFEAEGGSHS